MAVKLHYGLKVKVFGPSGISGGGLCSCCGFDSFLFLLVVHGGFGGGAFLFLVLVMVLVL